MIRFEPKPRNEDRMSSAIDLKNEGNKCYKEGNYVTAAEYYQQSLSLDPHYAPARYNLAQAYLKLANYQEALSTFDSAIAMDTTNYTYKGNLGKANALIGLEKPNDAWHVLNKLFIKPELSTEQKEIIAKEMFMIEQRIAAKVSFACVDLKFTKDDQIKILEFGRGMSSGLEGIDHLTPDFTSLQRLGCTALNEELPPMFFNGRPGFNIVPRQDTITPIFASLSAPIENMNISDLSQYLFIYGGVELRVPPHNICRMDDANLSYALARKNLIHEACVEAGFEDYRPKTMLINRQYTPTLADEIKRTIPGHKYVIKAPDVENGRGVIIATASDLDEHLKRILSSDLVGLFSMLAGGELSELYKSFFESDSDQFIIEEYSSSKPVSRGINLYDATMRVAFLYVRDKQESRCIPFAAYWKLPPQPINNSAASLRERTVSSFRDQRVDSLALTEADQHRVYAVLKDIIPGIFNTIITTNYIDRIKEIPRFSPRLIQKYGQDAQWVSYANYLALQGNFELAMFCLKQVNQNFVFPDNIEHFTGVACFTKGDVRAAINHFEIAERQLPNGMPNRHFRLFLAYLEIGDEARAWQCIQNNPEHMQKARMIIEPNMLDVSVKVSEQKKLGNNFFCNREYREALGVYDSIVRNYPSYAKIWFNIGLCHERLGEDEKALKEYEKAITYHPNYTKAKEYREKLLLKLEVSSSERMSFNARTSIFSQSTSANSEEASQGPCVELRGSCNQERK